MAAESSLSSYLDSKMLVTLIVAFVLIIVLVMLYHKFFPSQPAGSITQADYDKLTDAEKALYTKDSSGYWVKKA